MRLGRFRLIKMVVVVAAAACLVSLTLEVEEDEVMVTRAEVVVTSEADTAVSPKDLLPSRMFYLIPNVLSLINTNSCSMGGHIP